MRAGPGLHARYCGKGLPDCLSPVLVTPPQGDLPAGTRLTLCPPEKRPAAI